MNTYPLLIPYSKKDFLKTQFKLIWNKEKSLWEAKSENVYQQLADYHIIQLVVLYENKDIAKSLGAKWSGTCWITSRLNYVNNKEVYDSLKSPIKSTEPEEEEEKPL